MATYGFSEGDAKRIGKVVRLVERFPEKVSLGSLGAEGAAPGVRLLIAKHDRGYWATGATATVTVYNGDPGSLTAVGTIVAYNQFVQFSEDPVASARWVALGHNGFGWHPVDSQSDNLDCISEIGGIDFAVFVGFAKTATQILGHDGNGCIKWYDVFTCATAGS